MESSYETELGELVVSTEAVDVTSSLPKPDARWRYTDAAGHEHYWADGYPTLKQVVTDRYWCADCEDEHSDLRLECPLCGETIQPGTTGPSGWREYVPGKTTYLLGGEEITPERAREIIEAWRRGEDADRG